MSHPDDDVREDARDDLRDDTADDGDDAARIDFASLADAWRRMPTPGFAGDADDDAPVDAAERAALRWLQDAVARMPVPAPETHADDDVPSRDARAWMSAAWKRLAVPAPRALPPEFLPRGMLPPAWRRLSTRTGRMAAAALLLVSLALALRAGHATRPRNTPHDTPHDSARSDVVDVTSTGLDRTPTTEDRLGADTSHGDADDAAGLPRLVTAPVLALADRIESRSGRVRFVLLTGPPP